MTLVKALTALLVTLSFTAVTFVAPVQAAPPESVYKAKCGKLEGNAKERCARALLRQYPWTSQEQQYLRDVIKMEGSAFVHTSAYKLLTVHIGKFNCSAMTKLGAANDLDLTYRMLRERGDSWDTDMGMYYAATYIAGSYRFCRKHWPAVNAYFKEIY